MANGINPNIVVISSENYWTQSCSPPFDDGLNGFTLGKHAFLGKFQANFFLSINNWV
jgi:hypothetical protein